VQLNVIKLSDEVIKELDKKLGEYNKNDDVFNRIFMQADTATAVANAEKLQRYHMKSMKNYECFKCNPSTDINKIVKIILGKNKTNI